jgi:hypothetical protein
MLHQASPAVTVPANHGHHPAQAVARPSTPRYARELTSKAVLHSSNRVPHAGSPGCPQSHPVMISENSAGRRRPPGPGYLKDLSCAARPTAGSDGRTTTDRPREFIIANVSWAPRSSSGAAALRQATGRIRLPPGQLLAHLYQDLATVDGPIGPTPAGSRVPGRHLTVRSAADKSAGDRPQAQAQGDPAGADYSSILVTQHVGTREGFRRVGLVDGPPGG